MTLPATARARLTTHRVYGGALAGVLLLAVTPLLTPALPGAALLVWLCLPVCMLHQWEEHDGDRFRRFVNDRLAGGAQAPSVAAVFRINILGVWAVLAAALWLHLRAGAGWGLIAAARALVHVGAQSLALKASVGNRWTVGPRDTPAAPGPLAARLDRALRNYSETAVAFVALAVALALSGRESRIADAGILAWIIGRAVYLPAYVLAVPYARTAAWLVATTGIAAMLAGLILAPTGAAP